jgi:hypothetical protein
MTATEGYLEEFVSFWSERSEVKKIWFSLFTPQIGAADVEILDAATRKAVIDELESLKPKFSKLDLPRKVIEGYRKPPSSPTDCMFSRTTRNFTADLKSKVVPCQFGGTPDCSQCGCMASAGLAAIGEYKLLRALPLKRLYQVSDGIGKNDRQIFELKL